MINLRRIAHVELWVENASETATMYQEYFGFNRPAEANPQTGFSNHISIVLEQGMAKFIITSAINNTGPVADFVAKHGDGVRDIAFIVDDVNASFEHALSRGACALPHNELIYSKRYDKVIRAFGDLTHTFLETDQLALPYKPVTNTVRSRGSFSIQSLDHVAMCLEVGELNQTIDFYKHVLNFTEGQDEYVETKRSGMNSKVVLHGDIKFPLQEPLVKDAPGPISEFLKLNKGPGVYHLALLSENIFETLANLPGEVKVLDVPDTYYQQLSKRIQVNEPLDELQRYKILVDGDAGGYLMQVFTRSLHPRETLFLEIIERVHHDGFGSGNVRALFNAIEADRLKLAETIECSGRYPSEFIKHC